MITIYTIPNCDGCRHAIALCKFKKIPFQEISLDTQKKIDELHERLGGVHNIRVPMAIADDDTYIGHLPELKKYIDSNQYK